MGSDFTTIPIGPQPVQACPALGKDLMVTVYNQDGNNVVNLSRSNTGRPSTPLQPFASATFSADRAIYVSGTPGTKDLVVLPGGGYMAAGPVQIALATQQALQPSGIQTQSIDSVAGGTTSNLFTFSSAGRVWAAGISASYCTDNTYAAGFSTVSCSLFDDSGVPYISFSLDLALASPNQAVCDAVAHSYPNPLNIPQGVNVKISTGAAPPAHAFVRASFWVIESIP